MAIVPEILASVDSGEVIYVATESRIKRKWSELVAMSATPTSVSRYIPKYTKSNGLLVYNPIFTYLQVFFPDLSTTSVNSIDYAVATPLQISFIYWVILGDMPYRVYRAIKESWSSSLRDNYIQAVRDNDVDTFFDTYIKTIDGLRAGLGLDTRGDVDVLGTWLWGSNELINGFVTRIGGLENSEYSNIIPHEDYISIEELEDDISENTLADIKDKGKKFNPNRKKGIKKQKLHKKKKLTVEEEE